MVNLSKKQSVQPIVLEDNSWNEIKFLLLVIVPMLALVTGFVAYVAATQPV